MEISCLTDIYKITIILKKTKTKQNRFSFVYCYVICCIMSWLLYEENNHFKNNLHSIAMTQEMTQSLCESLDMFFLLAVL